MSTPTTVSDPVAPADTSQSRWFNEEVYRHDASLKNYLRHSFPSVRDVDDVVQESYLRVWRRQTLRPITQVTGSVKASVKSFLFQVARRLAIDTLRRKSASPLEESADLAALQVLEPRAGVSDAVCSNQEFELMLEAISLLPARCREVVILRKLYGLSPTETATRLQITEDTVHTLTRKGLQRVQDFLRYRGIIRQATP